MIPKNAEVTYTVQVTHISPCGNIKTVSVDESFEAKEESDSVYEHFLNRQYKESVEISHTTTITYSIDEVKEGELKDG